MGRQVSYVNYPQDVAPLEAFVRGSADVLFLRPRATAPEPVQVASLLIPATEPWRELLITRAPDVPRLRWQHLPAQGMWSIDKDASRVIEYGPGYGRDGTPHFPGASGAQPRMWFQARTWDGDTPVTAPDDFIAWADRVLGWVRRNWVLIDDFCYFSPAAAETWEALWRVVLDEPWLGPGAEQISRWRRAHDPENIMSADDFRVAITKARKNQPKRLIISIRREGSTPVGREDIYEFRLIADAGRAPISIENWQSLRSRILHLQPARSATLEGGPPRSIRIEGFGGTEVAPGLLADLERLAMTRLHVEAAD